MRKPCFVLPALVLFAGICAASQGGTYDPAGKSWKAEYNSPRVKTVWRLTVNGTHLTGTAQLVPGQQVIRTLDLQRFAG